MKGVVLVLATVHAVEMMVKKRNKADILSLRHELINQWLESFRMTF